MHCPLLVLILAGCAAAYRVEKLEQIEDDGWYLWKQAHKKAYQDFGEERVRYVIWQDNLKKIEAYNKLGKSHTLRINHFGDLTGTEFKQRNGLFKSHLSNRTLGSTFLAPMNVKAPEKVDWRTEGYVTPVKNQGQCGSCWAFSTTGSLEGQNFKKTGKLVSLSEENLVDCCTAFGNHGCNGGLMDNAFQCIKANGGIDTEESYPYTGVEGPCKFKKASVGATDTGFVDVTREDEDALKMAVATVGPISVAIDASHFSFQFFHTGVYDEPACKPEQLDHGVLVVGYGTYQGKDFWLVKNSWGPGWGMQGYIRMSRNKENQCGIASAASYPLV
jgi:cathepsin L